MHLVNVRLRTAAAGTAAAEDVRLAVLAAARPQDRLEHVYVEADDRGADVVLFLAHTWPSHAESAAAALCRRLVAEGTAVRGWIVERCSLGLIAGTEPALLDPRDPERDPGRDDLQGPAIAGP